MRILHTVQFYSPCVGGSEEVVRVLSEGLVRRGHEVVVATRINPNRQIKMINGVEIVEFDITGNAVQGLKGDVEKYRDFLRQNHFDVMMNYAAQIWSTDIPMQILEEITARKILVPCGYSELFNPQYQGYFRELAQRMSDYDGLIYLSENYRDKEFGDRHNVQHYSIIPNGASLNDFQDSNVKFKEKYKIREQNMLLCVANLYRAKGHNFVIDAFNKTGRDDTALVMIGNPPGSRLAPYNIEIELKACLNRHIYVLNNVPRQDVIAAYKNAEVFVFGSKIECSPLVIFESMAAGIPFISTKCGSVADLQDYGYIVANVQEMAQAIDYLLNNPQQRQAIGMQAKEIIRTEYNWERIIDRYESLYKKMSQGQ